MVQGVNGLHTSAVMLGQEELHAVAHTSITRQQHVHVSNHHYLINDQLSQPCGGIGVAVAHRQPLAK
jgi:hypothetical protein